MTQLKPLVFLPPFLLCVLAVVVSLLEPAAFSSITKGLTAWVMSSFGWLISLTAFSMVVLCGVIFVSPFGRTKLGGPDARPLLSKWQMFAVVLTTNIGAGILFWGPVEPMAYLSQPPASTQAAPFSPEAAQFAISTVYLHWTFTPYAIASVVGLMFAFAFYNMGQPFSLAAPLAPLLTRFPNKAPGVAIDAICLYALVAAMSAALAGASMLMGAGIHHVLGISGKPSNLLLAGIIAAIMAAAVAAAVSGVTRGIRRMASLNTMFLIGFLVLIVALGPARFILNFAVEGFGYFLSHYFEKVLWTGAVHEDAWPHDWSQMYFSAFFAWAPIMGVFLGRIAVGYSVRAFLVFNLLLPSLFTGIWMAVFCGAIVHLELFQGANLAAQLDLADPSRVLYSFLGNLPWTNVLIPLLLVTSFLSFVTTADGNTDAMSSISSTGISPEHPEASIYVKSLWGLLVGLLAWIMVSDARLDGVRQLSTLGGFPALFICIAIGVCAIMVINNPARFERFAKTPAKPLDNADKDAS